jgi:hypothetical protein
MSGSRMPRAGVWLALVSVLCVVPICGFGQSASFGTISGVVTDPSGAVVPGVGVTIVNAGTLARYSTITNSSGFYSVPNLPSGHYNVIAEKKGFERFVSTNVHLDPAASVQVRCEMRVGTVTQTVHVTSPLVQVQLSSPQVSRLISAHTLSQLPVNGRNFESLLALQPGVATTFTFNSYLGTNLGPTADTDVNGLTGESNNLVIDGAPSTRTRGNTDTIAPPSMAAVAEVNVVTNSFMPEYNRAGGGQIIVSIKSGTDQYHGEAFEFDRNNVFDARSFFSTSVPKLDLNDFGFDIGGPVIPKKHKLYFFWAEEWLREVDGNTGLGTVPSVDDRAGDLTNYCAATPDFCPKVPSYLNGVDGLVAGQPFPNDTIPTSLWSANGSAMAKLYELPDTPGIKSGEADNYLYDYPTTEDDREDDIKMDDLATEKNHLAVTLRQFEWSSFNPAVASAEAQLLDETQPFHDQSASVDLATTFTPTLLNDLTLTANRDIVHKNMSGGPGLDRTALGIDFPYIYGDSSKDLPNKIPSVTVAGYSEINGEPYPSHSAGHIYTIQDVLTKIAGNNTIKTGFWWEHDGENDDDQVRIYAGGGVSDNMNGYFTWDASTSNPNTTGSPYADALLGNFDSYSEVGFRNETPWTAFQVGPFAQDTWRVTRRLTIMGGLRWDYFEPNSSKWNNWAIFDPLFYSTLPGVEPVVNPTTGYVTSGDPYDGIMLPGDGLPESAVGHFSVFGEHLTAANLSSINAELRQDGMVRGLSSQILQSHFRNFEPRLGFAFDPTGHGTTVIRAAGGVFYQLFPMSDVGLFGGNTPFQLGAETANGHADDPAGAESLPLPIPMTGTDLANPTPVVYEWNFTVQHDFAGNTLVDVGYVGDQARNIGVNADLNQPAVGTFTNPANAGISDNALRPYPGLGTVVSPLEEASSGYNSLQVSVQRRFSRDLQYGFAYTYSKCLDDSTGKNSYIADTYDPGYDWGPCSFNPTQSLIPAYVYDLPFLQNNHSLLGRTLGGWEVSGALAFMTGDPLSVAASGDPLGNGADLIGATEFADLAPGCAIRGSRSFYHFFNTSCFSQPTVSTLTGAAPEGLLEGPGLDNWDFALMKNGHITERLGYQFRAEFFNFLNHPSFDSVDATVTDSTFGQINGVDTQREIQLGLKLTF